MFIIPQRSWFKYSQRLPEFLSIPYDDAPFSYSESSSISDLFPVLKFQPVMGQDSFFMDLIWASESGCCKFKIRDKLQELTLYI